jgi:hypothetical protein
LIPLPESSKRSSLWRRLAALLLVIVALGLPINDLFRYALLILSTVVIFVGIVSARPRPWLVAIAIVELAAFGQVLFAAPRIEEGGLGVIATA